MVCDAKLVFDKALINIFFTFDEFWLGIQSHLFQDDHASTREELIRNCHGHPYSLHFVAGLVSNEVTPTTDCKQISTADTESINTLLAEELHAQSFSKFDDFKKTVLLALALFERDAEISALHYVS